MTEEKNEAKIEKSPTPPPPAPAPKGRGAFYYIDGLLVRLSLLVLIVALLWNWDGFWTTNIKFLTDAQTTYFPIKYETGHLKIEALEEKNQSLKMVAQTEAELIAFKKKAVVLWRHYDASLRIIKRLNRKVSPEAFEEALKCNSPECESILNSNPESDPMTYSEFSK